MREATASVLQGISMGAGLHFTTTALLSPQLLHSNGAVIKEGFHLYICNFGVQGGSLYITTRK